jgi:hypothetical protein
LNVTKEGYDLFGFGERTGRGEVSDDGNGGDHRLQTVESLSASGDGLSDLVSGSC